MKQDDDDQKYFVNEIIDFKIFKKNSNIKQVIQRFKILLFY